MNEITIAKIDKDIFQAGSLFSDDDGDIYILSKSCGTKDVVTTPLFTAASLADGNSWNGSFYRPEEAVEGLRFFGRNMKIEIKGE